MASNNGDAIGFTVFFGFVTTVGSVIAGTTGHWTAFGLIIGAYTFIVGGLTAGTGLIIAVLDALEEGRELKRAVRKAQATAQVEEINLSHELEMERIRLEKYRVTHELKQMYKEEGVEIPAPVSETPNEEEPRRANRSNRSRG